MNFPFWKGKFIVQSEKVGVNELSQFRISTTTSSIIYVIVIIEQKP